MIPDNMISMRSEPDREWGRMSLIQEWSGSRSKSSPNSHIQVDELCQRIFFR